MLHHRHCPFARLTLLWVFLFACVTRPLYASPVDDLASPDQSVRDTAAAFLRTNYISVGSTHWDTLLAPLKIGEAKTNVLALLQSIGATNTSSRPYTNHTTSETYWLDDYWWVVCIYHDTNDTLAYVEVFPQSYRIKVEAPPHFTGRWTAYYVTGQIFHETYYEDGKRHGPDVIYRADGAPRFIGHYVHGLLEGESISFYPDGHIDCWVTRKAGKIVKTYKTYYEDTPP